MIFSKKIKKSQIWYIDFMVGILIFVIVITMYFKFAYNISEDPSKILNDMIMDAKAVSSSLLTRGSPLVWNKTNVTVVGITDGNQRIMQNKLNNLTNMTYLEMKDKIRTSYEFYLFFEYFNNTRILINGNQGVGNVPVNQKNLVSIKRGVIYNSGLISMVVQVWQQ